MPSHSPADSQAPQSPDTLVNEIRLHPSVTFVPIAPLAFNRYDRGRYIKPVAHDYVLHPVSRIIHREPLAEWIPHEHPEGAVYFRNREKQVFTDEDLYDPAVLWRLSVYKEQILRRQQADHVLRSGNVDLVLDILTYDKGHLECAYYFVDHSERLIFWIDDFHMNKLTTWRRLPGITTATHVKLGLEIEYWRHVQYFPSTLPISGGVLKELRSLIMFGITDTMTSPTTTLPFPTQYMFQMLSVIDTLATDGESVGPTEVSTTTPVRIDTAWGVAIGRFMFEFALAKFYNANGESYARLDGGNSIYGMIPKTSSPLMLLSVFHFGAARQHLINIHTMFKDGNLNCQGWKHFVRNLRSEWQETILFGTLILNANVGFLAISSGTMALEPLARTLSYISVFFGLGSIMTGIFLSRRYAQEDHDAGFSIAASEFFGNRSVIGVHSLAILYSLPYGFMIWGMITFLSAFVTMAVHSVTGGSRYLVLGIFAAITLSALGHLTAEYVVRFTHKKLFSRSLAGRLRGVFQILYHGRGNDRPCTVQDCTCEDLKPNGGTKCTVCTQKDGKHPKCACQDCHGTSGIVCGCGHPVTVHGKAIGSSFP